MKFIEGWYIYSRLKTGAGFLITSQLDMLRMAESIADRSMRSMRSGNIDATATTVVDD